MNGIFNLRTYLSVIFILVFLASCASQPKVVDKKPVEKESKPTKEVTLNNAELALKKAESEWLKNRDINQRNALLLAAAQDFQTGGECGRADIIIANIEPFLEDPLQQQYSSLLKAECVLIQHYASGLSNELIPTPIDTMIGWLASITADPLISRKEVLIAHLAALHERWDLATNVLSQQLRADSPLNQQQEQLLWKWFLKSSKSTQNTLGRSSEFMRAYSSLANILEDENLTDSSRQQAIQYWQQQYPTHPISVSLPEGVRGYLDQKLKEVRNIAVLLPLSGRVQVQGDAIKQGIMAAYFAKLENINKNNPGQVIPNITFLDTGSENNAFVSDKITPEGLMEFDIVIGPLLRDHVTKVKSFNLPESMMVYLNRLSASSKQIDKADSINSDDLAIANLEEELSGIIDGSTEPSSENSSAAVDARETAKVYFALAPEDEAIQLANLMKKRGVRTPIIISNDSSVSRRMIDSFNQHWIALNGIDDITPPKIVTFSDNKGLRIGITAALDVLQSQRRIRQMSSLTTETVHSVTRNRRDVDAFVVFALPQQVELLNPIIEASISLFTERTIPVFATSYSYQHQLNKNSIRDLRNLVFVDMPFLMPKQRNSELAKLVDLSWNEPPSSFLRLFAFGYDAFQFSEQMQQLAYFSHTDLKGLSGKLSVNSARQVTRSLPSAVIENDSITQVGGF
ncbi:penicillin-binding protein activator [Glaciecola sp.]|uniref:penicillin-binding protein activator n=1 Tax=Glaciecola sp. MF2-115 TaxID=3384827 RepID=UPI003989D39A